MANLSAALVDRAMAIAMPSGLHSFAVVEQECVVDCKLSAEKQRSLSFGASDDQSRALRYRFSIDSNFKRCSIGSS